MVHATVGLFGRNRKYHRDPFLETLLNLYPALYNNVGMSSFPSRADAAIPGCWITCEAKQLARQFLLGNYCGEAVPGESQLAHYRDFFHCCFCQPVEQAQSTMLSPVLVSPTG